MPHKSWRKRQAEASDQQSWRALGTDSALWKSIERNSTNAKIAVAGVGTKTTGIVTGLKLSSGSTGQLITYAAANKGQVIVVSDASDSSIATTARTDFKTGKFDTPFDLSCNTTGNGLVFSANNYNDQHNGVVTNLAYQDISGSFCAIHSGGSGYKAGQTFACNETLVAGLKATGGEDLLVTITSVTSTAPEPGRN
jgi:hypothetical protein